MRAVYQQISSYIHTYAREEMLLAFWNGSRLAYRREGSLSCVFFFSFFFFFSILLRSIEFDSHNTATTVSCRVNAVSTAICKMVDDAFSRHLRVLIFNVF